MDKNNSKPDFNKVFKIIADIIADREEVKIELKSVIKIEDRKTA